MMRELSHSSNGDRGGFGSSLQSSGLHFFSKYFYYAQGQRPQNSTIRSFNGSISPKYF